MSSIGDGLAFVAVPLLAAQSTRDPRLVAGVAVANRLAWMLIGLPAGALADCLPRARTLAAVETARAALLVAVAVLAVTGRSPLGFLLVLSFALGGLEALFSGLTFAGLPEIVDDDRLGVANGRLYTVECAGQFFVGPAIGGLLFAATRSLPFAIDAATFAVSGLLLTSAFGRLPRRPNPASISFRDEVRAGWRYVVDTPLIRALTAMTATYAFFQAVATATLVVYCLQRLHTGLAGYGLFIAVGSIGDVAGGAVAGRLADRYPAGKIFAGAGVTTAGCYLVLGLAPTLALAAPALAAEAVAVACANVASLAMRQRTVPHELLGRVGNTMRVFVCSAVTAGLVIGGMVASRLGLAAPFVIAGIGQLAAVGFLARLVHRASNTKPDTHPTSTPIDHVQDDLVFA